MGVNHPGLGISLEQLIRMVRREAVATLQNASIGRAGLRVYDGGWILIEGGGLSVTGTATVSGVMKVTGELEGSGTLDWTGPWSLEGDGTIPGDVRITGDVDIIGKLVTSGAVELGGNTKISGKLDVTGAASFDNSIDVLKRLTLGPSGYIEAGTVRIDRLGSYGGRIASTGPVLAIGASGSVTVTAPYLVANDISATNATFIGTMEATTKAFKIPHPIKVDNVLRHGATESPVSGVEYWGEETLPESGELAVTLPDYFEALTKPDNRAVLVAARGFVADWGDIEDGKFTVTGVPGGQFSWLVKAEREGAEFVLEEPVYGPIRA